MPKDGWCGTYSGGRPVLPDATDAELADNLKFEYAHATSSDKSIKKPSCEAKLTVGGGSPVLLQYESQLDDKNEHLVSIKDFRNVDAENIALELTAAIQASRAKSATAVASVATPALVASDVTILEAVPASSAPASAEVRTATPTDAHPVNLRPLSPAAEEAISEGFVDITDPAVSACTDAKVAAFHKSQGDDAPLNYDVFNEFAVACGFNI